MGRYIRYWYTYRTVVAVLLALVLSGVMYWMYTQQLACDAQPGSCLVYLAGHPEDRFVAQSNPDGNIVIVGLDDASVSAIGVFPVPRDRYASLLQNLEKAGASVVAFDIAFPDPRETDSDKAFADALAKSTIPVVLAYGGSNAKSGSGRVSQTGVDQIPLRKFRCADVSSTNTPCTQPYPNVILASTDYLTDNDGVLRRLPMFVEPACFAKGACSTPTLNPIGFTAYRAWLAQGVSGPALEESDGEATFALWKEHLPVDGKGAALINYFGPPGNYEDKTHYLSFGDVFSGTFSSDAVKGKLVLVGDYYLTGVHDEVLATTSAGAGGKGMPGVEMHANVAQMLIESKFLSPEPPLAVFLAILLAALVMAVIVARVSVIWGLMATVVAVVGFAFAVAAVAASTHVVPNVLHPLLAIALTYTGVTAYRFLYEDREKRKVTSLFGQYLKPEIVAQLAKTRGGVEDILRGGERREITLLFVDVRGFTSMSERMQPDDVVNVVQLYLDHLSGIIFTWDGTVDKYVGDEIVAFWNAPRLQGNHALLAIRCAYDLINRAPELQTRLMEKGLPPIRWGIGINTGPAVVGNLGSRSRLQYTAIGDTVNTAARFCANAPAFHLLIGQPTYEMCKDYIAVDMVPGVQLKGKSAETFRIYQVTAIRETPTSPWVQFPTEMAAEAHQVFTQQYTQKSILAAANTGAGDILVGEAAEQALAGQAAAEPTPGEEAAIAPTPPYGTPTLPRA
ncbi:MAG: adenylate/guanylate cyclase domain-containing protein [Chloroflexi bacterium]|nr:MAG: adenylate/guanylate cyclase domain-containing protein [Chloroflexota bacterium]